MMAPGKPELSDLSKSRFAALLTSVFVVVVAIGMSRHEIWLDEWQAWLLARDSGSLAELLYNMRDEGHPAAWHALLFAVSRFTRSVIGMQGLQLAIAGSAIWLLARYGPFSRLNTALLTFSYFPAFEYGVISRSYGLGMLALFGVCVAWKNRRDNWLPLALWLALLCQTSVYGVILAMSFGCGILVEVALDGDTRRSLRRRSTALGAALVLLSIFAAVEQMRPREDGFEGAPAVESEESLFESVREVGLVPVIALLPFPGFEDGLPTWGYTYLVHIPGIPNTPVLGSLLLIAFAILAARRPAALALLIAGTTGLLLFSLLFFYGLLRHNGHLMLLVIAVVWLASLPGKDIELPGSRALWERLTTTANWMFTLVLLVQTAAFVQLWTADLKHPFTHGFHAAQVLREHGAGAPNTKVVAASRAFSTTVAGYLDVPIHRLDDQTTGTFAQWGAAWEETPEDSIVAYAARSLDGATSAVLLVTQEPLPPASVEGISVQVLPRDTGPGLNPVRFFSYRITTAPETPG